LLLSLLTGWLDLRSEKSFVICSKRIVLFAASCGVDACS
jgi:hypothetical protein